MKRKAYRDAFVSGHISTTVSAQIAMLREENGWTQKQLADKAGMRQPRISALEDPNCENYEVDTLKRLASAFDVGLTVRFEPFSEIVSWASSVTDAKIAVPSFEDDAIEVWPSPTRSDEVPSLGARTESYALPDPSRNPKPCGRLIWQISVQ
jgi:transcriptional regulator with XRE-family HTH domain